MTRGSELSRVRLDGDLPKGWSAVPEAGTDLRIDGPIGSEGVAGTLRVWVDSGVDGGIKETSMLVMKELQAARPEAILANCELWPHPVWGDGRYIQSAYIDGRKTMAHDTYLFVSKGRRVRVEVDCALADLLALEETVATLVARLDDAMPVLR
ncbi:MAG: hypothetical protein Q4P32_01110 [Micrococcales bacterium]|nr:hypothetical protein [Micrococcales bacterium]